MKSSTHTRTHTPTLFESTTDAAHAVQKPLRQQTPVFSVRLVRERSLDTPIVKTPEEVAQVFSEYLADCDREHFAVAFLSTRNQLIGLHTCHIGALAASIVSVRDVFKAAILANAASIIVAHNHPSGNLEPSVEDLRITQKLADAGKLMEVPVLDSLIIGFDGKFTSLAERSLVA